jgi:DMSO/TMAO reductase YedYZ molybdopterin-dependent catalytic subunit
MKKARDENYQWGDPPTSLDLPEDVIISQDTQRAERLPPGQTRTRKWPVLDASGTPDVDYSRWRLEVDGLVERPFQLSLEEFRQLPRVQVFADFHCVTRWSRLGNLWEGVSTRILLQRAGIRAEARFAILHACDRDWSANLPLEDFLAAESLLADTHDGRPINADHGGPVRAVVPHLYAWKSAKWLRRIELTDVDRPGYWERVGYHNHGDPWTEERFRGDSRS